MKTPLIIAFTLLTATLCIAQKSTSDALTIPLVVKPAVELQPAVKTYTVEINTLLPPLTAAERNEVEREAREKKADEWFAVREAKEKKLESYKKTYLEFSDRIRVQQNGDLSVILKTSDTKITNRSTVPLSQLKMQDEVFRFTVWASLQIIDKAGTVLHTTMVVDSTTEISVIKAAMYSTAQTVQLAGKRAPDAYVPENLVLEKILVLADQALADAVEVQQPSFIVGVFSVKGKPFSPLNETQTAVKEAYGKFNALNKKNRISKEELGKVLNDAQVVWEKFMTEKKSEMDERAYKGLALNCALACTWNNEFDKANTWLSKLSAADFVAVEQLEEDEPEDAPSMGATVMLSFEQYASNLQKFITTLKNNSGRTEFAQ